MRDTIKESDKSKAVERGEEEEIKEGDEHPLSCTCGRKEERENIKR